MYHVTMHWQSTRIDIFTPLALSLQLAFQEASDVISVCQLAIMLEYRYYTDASWKALQRQTDTVLHGVPPEAMVTWLSASSSLSLESLVHLCD
jgi:hypothetical protein